MSLTYDVLKDDVRAGRPIDFGFVTYVPERTCRVESSHVEQEIGYYPYLEVELSCGHCFTWDDGTPPDYCPYCGAKVEVDE